MRAIRSFFVVGAVLACAGLAQVGRGQEAPLGPGGGSEFHSFLEALKAVSLTTEQQSDVTQLLSLHHTQMEQLVTSWHAAKEQVASALSSSDESAAQLASLRAEAERLRAQIEEADFDAALEIRTLLTADQRSALETAHARIQSLARNDNPTEVTLQK